MADSLLGEPIVIRFDGLDADNHTLELVSLSEALSGLARIIASSGHFAVTEELSLRRDTQDVRVVAKPPERACFQVEAIVQFAHHHPMFKDYAIATLSGLTGSLIAYIFSKAAGKRAEMKMLKESLDTAIRELGSRDQPTIDRLLATIDRMADGLRPAVKRAVAPIGASARTLTVGPASASNPVVIDEADKAAIMSPAGLTVDDERAYTVLISELDMQTGACHVEIEGDELGGRHPAKITDPEASLPNNVYVLSMAAQQPLAVRAKATMREGAIERLFISNHDGRQRGEPDFKLR
jgi:hypothetical protein